MSTPGPILPAVDAASASPAAAAKPFFVVGIGASAGGLAALDQLFSAIARDTEPAMAYVLVQHLAPDHASVLATLIQRHTFLPVFQVENGMRVEPGRVYIIPPNSDLALVHGALQVLQPAVAHGRRLPIDAFLRTLATDCGERAIAVILSGTGSDGSLGVRAIKAAGGMVLVQDPESAEYDGMPRNALATGLVDLIATPEQMPGALAAYATHFAESEKRLDSAAHRPLPTALASVFALLRARTGHDFSQYKKRTILRRIERRMVVQQIADLPAYAHFLEANATEVGALFRDLLIGVTGFFRDPEAFHALESALGPLLFKTRAADATIRVWVPGCSTGEEAYSLAILLQEQLEAAKRPIRVQIFATDIDAGAIERARTGVYSAAAVADLTPERRARFFAPHDDGTQFRVAKFLREMLVFSEQDIIRDPPFSRLDLISCRNLLIYLGPELQRKVIPLFHYALNPGGLLLLGTSESVGHFSDFFALIDPKAKLYARRGDMTANARRNGGLLLPTLSLPVEAVRTSDKVQRMPKIPLRELTERTLLAHHTPAAVLVQANGDILFVHGRTGRYLEPAPGESNLNVLKMAREGLTHELHLALHQAIATGKTVHCAGLRCRSNDGVARLDLTIRVVPTEGDAVFYLVVMEEPRAPQEIRIGLQEALEGQATEGAHIARLKRDLQTQADSLRAITDDLESSNEELRAANEELQSVNEELQSTNEELETSKEELQAVNEELANVNAELQQRVTELSRANSDMNNLMAATGVGTIFLDPDLRIQRFTPAVTAVINLIATDVGRPVGQIVSNLLGYDTLVADVRAVLATLAPQEHEVRSATAWYLLRIRPYRTPANVIEGAVLTFTDITALKRSQEAMRRLAVVVHDSRDAILVQDLAGQILAWNGAAEREYGWTEAEALAKNMSEFMPLTAQPRARDAVERLRAGEVLGEQTSQRIAKDGRVLDIELTATALVTESGAVYAISTTERVAHDGPGRRVIPG